MRYIVGFLITLGLIAILVVLLISGGGNDNQPVTRNKTLVDYASTDAQVRMTIDGPVNADSLHEQVRVTVDNADVTFEHVHGYQGDVVDTKLFANNQAAYDVFLHALQHAGFSRGSNDPDLRDERGYCPTGDRYIFELIQDGKTLQRYWSSTCNSPKTYLGATGLTLTLFKAQVPAYDTLSASILL